MRRASVILGGALLLLGMTHAHRSVTFAAPPGQEQRTALPRLKVSLVTAKSTYRVGERVDLTYSLHNLGSQPFYVSRTLDLATGGPAGVRIEITPTFPGGIASDTWLLPYDPKTPIEEIVYQRWILLYPGNFYGLQTQLSGVDLPRRPGRYRLTATYLDHTDAWLLPVHVKALRSLDHPILFGDFRSEPVWIEIRN